MVIVKMKNSISSEDQEQDKNAHSTTSTQPQTGGSRQGY
jgi:hypothetical protein